MEYVIAYSMFLVGLVTVIIPWRDKMRFQIWEGLVLFIAGMSLMALALAFPYLVNGG